MMRIDNWLSNSTKVLQAASIESARLDCLILLEYTLNYSRVEVLTRLDEEIPQNFLLQLNEFLRRRRSREPIAYILGTKEFYGRIFTVSNSVLIPRPESEYIINMSLLLPLKDKAHIADVGTGSGILAITLSLEFPKATLHAYDIDRDALDIATSNSTLLNARVSFIKSNLLDATDDTYDLIVANLPYVSSSQVVSPETIFEPDVALFAKDDGLDIIYTLLSQIVNQSRLVSAGHLLLESEPRQHQRILNFASNLGYSHIRSSGFIQLFKLV